MEIIWTLVVGQNSVCGKGEWADNRVDLVGMAEDVVVLFAKVRHHCSAGASEQRSNLGGCVCNSAKIQRYFGGQKCGDNARRPMTSDHIEN